MGARERKKEMMLSSSETKMWEWLRVVAVQQSKSLNYFRVQRKESPANSMTMGKNTSFKAKGKWKF